MAIINFYPADVARNLIDETDIDEDELYNDRDGVTRAQLTLLSGASRKLGTITNPDGKTTTLKENVYKTIHRLHASANKKNIDFAANVKNTMYNTIQFEVMNQLEQQTTPADRKTTMIKWLPSTANEQDPFHALNYGKTMSMQSALDKGLGTRYGCQCGMAILSPSGDIEKFLEKSEKL